MKKWRFRLSPASGRSSASNIHEAQPAVIAASLRQLLSEIKKNPSAV
jgi:hypothetical protein